MELLLQMLLLWLVLAQVPPEQVPCNEQCASLVQTVLDVS